MAGPPHLEKRYILTSERFFCVCWMGVGSETKPSGFSSEMNNSMTGRWARWARKTLSPPPPPPPPSQEVGLLRSSLSQTEARPWDFHVEF